MVKATCVAAPPWGSEERVTHLIETMSTRASVDLKRHGHLLAKTTPRINTEADNERMLAVVDKLMRKGEEKLTSEEDALLERLVGRIHDCEEERYPIPKSAPHEMLSYLLDQKGLMPQDLWAVLGSKSCVSEILSGKRSISKEQARRLTAFQVSVALFI